MIPRMRRLPGTSAKDVYGHLLEGDRRAAAESMSRGFVRWLRWSRGSPRNEKPLPAGKGL